MKSGVCQPGICGIPPAGPLNVYGCHTPPKVSARVSLAFEPRRHFGTRAPGRVESALGELGGSLWLLLASGSLETNVMVIGNLVF